MEYRWPKRIERLDLPEHAPNSAKSIRAAERELETLAFGNDLLDLTYADTKRFPPPSWVLEDFAVAANGKGMAYTPYRGDKSVRDRVGPSAAKFLGVAVDPERNLILTPGTQAGLFLALSAIVENGDRVLLVDPDYLSSERMLRFLGATVDHVPLIWEGDKQPTLDFDYLERALENEPRLLLFSHPNNPTGAVYSSEVMQKIVDMVLRKDMFVLVDQLYSRLVYDQQPFEHLIAFEGLRERCITLLGPSKTESMSGYRVGVAVAPTPIIDRMEDVLGSTALRAPAYAQHVLGRWLSDEDYDFVERRINEYQELRDVTLERFNETDLIDVTIPQGTAYMFPRVVNIDEADDQLIAKQLQTKAHVIVNPGYQFGPRGKGHFRICFAQDERVWSSALDRILDTLWEFK